MSFASMTYNMNFNTYIYTMKCENHMIGEKKIEFSQPIRMYKMFLKIPLSVSLWSDLKRDRIF